MIHFQEVFKFDSPKITAASGLVLSDGHFHCVSDDELGLIRIPRLLQGGLQRIELFEGSLPEDPKSRKKLKPDLEAMVHLSETNSILCIPSGSKANRTRGALLDSGLKVHEVGFEKIYGRLSREISDLNIEGAISLGSRLLLFQRGNGKSGQNAIINLALEDFLSDQANDFEVTQVDLGEINGERLGFTDACMDQGSSWFLAAAERTESTYEDGEFVGAILGKLNSERGVELRYRLDLPYKPEGLVIQGDEVFVVTDADDRSVNSRLYFGRI
jgi:hypothetical protein